MADEIRVITVNQGTAQQWANQARPLEAGEFGYATDTKELKIGDGARPWAALPTLKPCYIVTPTQYAALPSIDPASIYYVSESAWGGGGNN